ncbi:efflux RND transporter periplasmic adaptor subunit [Pseudorhodobacter sp. W20_MBD10_FR17]|uniref:efflux RND transporter periplasmic adaptor subunit n=1 Tax=Pseudorhodobacter sp. W20_MBD10_FR17 TaxID=3240266 RepID=UPI003F99663C
MMPRFTRTRPNTHAFALAVGAVFALHTPATAQTLLRVSTVTAERIAAVSTFSLTGEIVARDTLTASFPLGGRVTDVFVTTGAKVQKGDVLAKLDQVQQEQSLRAAQAGLVSAKASHQQAREESVRQDALLERGATTRSARDTAADLLRAAEAQEAQAVAEQDRAKKALADTVLLAPTAATVTDRLAEPGQVIGAAQTVVELALGSDFDAEFEVPEATLTSTPKSPEVVLSVLAAPSKTGAGMIREVSPLVDPAKGTVKVTVSVETLPAGLSYGDPVRGTVTIQDTDRVTLPWSSITAQASGPAVWLIDPQTHQAALREVSVLRYISGQVVLSSGVEAGEIVVSKGAQLLYPGQTVDLGSEAK